MFQNIYIEKTFAGLMVHLWDDQAGHSLLPYKDFDYAYKIDANGTIPSLLGQMTKKVKRWQRDDPLIIESDLPKETRVLTDLYQDSDEPAQGHRIVVFDIEVDIETGLPDIFIADKAITSIAVEDKITGDEYVFILDEDGELDEYENKDVIIFNAHSEEELLTDFLDIWEQINPTIITGWNIDYFDVPYLYRRLCEVLGEDEASRLSPEVGLIHYVDRKDKYQIAGVSALDYLDLYKKFTYQEQPNHRLDTIAKIELGEGKYEYEGTLADLKKDDIEGYLEYNLNDVRLVSKIDDKKKLLQLVIGVCTLGHVPYEEYASSSRWLEGALVVDLHRKGIVCPNKTPRAEAELKKKKKSGKKGFKGAYVKEPQSGRHEWVFSLDLQSLYPSIIMSLNISPETKVGKILKWNLKDYLASKTKEYTIEEIDGKKTTLSRAGLTQTVRDGKLTLSSNGILYRTDKIGIIPETLDRWFAERIEYQGKKKDAAAKGDTEQKEYWDMRQHIQKIFLNSVYGLLGLSIFRFYDLDNALAVTSTGIDVIKTSAKYVNSHFNKELGTKDEDYCIYIDTDSVYFSVKKLGEKKLPDWKDLAITTARQMESELNTMYDQMAKSLFFVPGKHRLHIKGETISSVAFWVTKKRYAMKKVYDLESDSDIDEMGIKGLDVVRSSFPMAFRKFMKEILVDILDDASKDDLDAKILDFHSRLAEMDIVDIARNTAVKNVSKYIVKGQKLNEFAKGTPAHVKAAITHNQLLKEWNINLHYAPITNGVKIKYVYLKSNPYRVQTVAFIGDDTDAPLLNQLITEFIDYDELFEREFSKKLKDFYRALAWGRIPTEVNQKASEFFAF